MNLKFFTLFVAIFTVSLVIAQECPPDCSGGKITDSSYSNPDSYKNDEFYKKSDPQKWQFNNPNFNYKRIPTEKYKHLPYENPDMDHSQLEPNKYIAAMGCQTCSFRLATVGITYSSQGVIHPKTGIANIPSDYPPNTLFLATNEGIFILLPKEASNTGNSKIIGAYAIDPVKTGNVIIIANENNIFISGYNINADRLKIKDGVPNIIKNFPILVDGITIKSSSNDVALYFDGLTRTGNYVSFGKNNFVAEGNNFDLEFSGNNRHVRVYDKKLRSGVFNQEDYLYFSIGKENEKNGKIELINREISNDMSLIKTNGYVRMWNDRNDVIIDGNKITNNYYRTFAFSPSYRQGSVSLQLIPEGDNSNIWVFDENRRIFPVASKHINEMSQMRESILREYNVLVYGFLDYVYLDQLKTALSRIQDLNGIDFRMVEHIKGKKIEFIEGDQRLETKNAFARAVLGEYQAFFMKDLRPDTPNRIAAYSYADRGSYIRSASMHEIGHLFTGPELLKKLKIINMQYGLGIPDYDTESKNPVPKQAIPSDYSGLNLVEFAAELFKEKMESPEISWFGKELLKNEPDFAYWQQAGPDSLSKYKSAVDQAWNVELEQYRAPQKQKKNQ